MADCSGFRDALRPVGDPVCVSTKAGFALARGFIRRSLMRSTYRGFHSPLAGALVSAVQLQKLDNSGKLDIRLPFFVIIR